MRLVHSDYLTHATAVAATNTATIEADPTQPTRNAQTSV